MKVMDVMKMQDVESVELKIDVYEYDSMRFRFEDFQSLLLFDVVPRQKSLAFTPHPNSCYYAEDILHTDLHDDYYARGGIKLCLNPRADRWRSQMGECSSEYRMLGWSPFFRLKKSLDFSSLFIRYRNTKDGIPRKAKAIDVPYVCERCPGVPESEDLFFNALSKSWQDESGALHIEVSPEIDARNVE